MMMTGLARLGRDAEVRHTQGGDAVCTLALAMDYGKKDQNGKRPTQWVEAALWGKRAESLAPFMTKGSSHLFYLSDVHIETYQGSKGEGHKLVARVLDVELGPRAPGQQRGDDEGYGSYTPSPAPAPRRAPTAARAPAPPPAPRSGSGSGSGFDDMDDDIHF